MNKSHDSLRFLSDMALIERYYHRESFYFNVCRSYSQILMIGGL